MDEYRYNGEDDDDEDESGNKKKNTVDFDKYVYNSEAVDLQLKSSKNDVTYLNRYYEQPRDIKNR